MGQAGAGVEMAERRFSRRPWLLIQTFPPRASCGQALSRWGHAGAQHTRLSGTSRRESLAPLPTANAHSLMEEIREKAGGAGGRGRLKDGDRNLEVPEETPSGPDVVPSAVKRAATLASSKEELFAGSPVKLHKSCIIQGQMFLSRPVPSLRKEGLALGCA